jgi:hypothetical protein
MWDEMGWAKNLGIEPITSKIELNMNAWSELFGTDYDVSAIYSMEYDVVKYCEDTRIKKVQNADRILRIMVLPSFEPFLRKCYELHVEVQTKDEGEYYRNYRQYSVLRMTWDEWNDTKRLQKIERESHKRPNIVHDFRLVETNEALSIMGGFEAAKIPSWSLELAFDNFSGEDGKTIHVWFGDGFWGSVKYSWWEEAPKAWAELEKATHGAMSHIDKLLEE